MINNIGGGIDAWIKTFYYRYEDFASVTRIATLPAPCHTPTTSLVAYAFFTGFGRSEEEVVNMVGSTTNTMPKDDFGDNPRPPQMATLQL